MINTDADLTPVGWYMDTEMSEDAMLSVALKHSFRYGVRGGDMAGAEDNQNSTRVLSCM